MRYTIENKKIAVTVDSLGAELVSLKTKADDCEYVWQGDPTYWTGHAYNLFPICGRLTDGKYTYKGETYEMNLHGFARKTEYEMVEQTENTLVFHLGYNEKTLAMYPFKFDLTITYTIDGTSVATKMSVHNADDKEMIFAVGTHPGFNLPLGGEGDFEDWCISFDEKCAPEALVMSPTCYYMGKTEPFALKCGRRLDLKHSLFDNDAIFLANAAKGVTLKSSKSKKSVHMEYPKMNYVGLWHAPGTEAPYVCIEPWVSIPADDGVVDDFETKRDMLRLAPAGDYENTFTITVK